MIRIAIIGMGLMGTSLGMALRQSTGASSPLGEVHITGYDQDTSATIAARGRLAIDQEARSLPEAMQGAHMVVLATPPQTMQTLFAELAPLLKAETIVTDMASTKARICTWARELLPPGVDFVPGHPMAGKEQAGAQAADPDLFQGAIYCLCPDQHIRQQAIDTVESLVLAVGAKPYYIDPEEHDAYVAGISHLPFVLSAALVHVTSSSVAWKEMAPLAASGFRDVSRLASGDVVMHRDICLTNQVALTRWLDDTMAALAEVRDMLQRGDTEQVHTLFEQARQQRDEWLASKPHLRPGEAALQSAPQVERPGLLSFLLPSRRKEK